jgi:uncharacterized protein YggE
MRLLPSTLLVVAAGLGLASCAGGDTPDRPATITARGTGEVIGVPDVLHLNLSVETRATTATEALADDSRRTQAVLDRLEAAGVAKRDLQTTGLSLSPVYDDEGQRITAYQASNAVAVTLRDLDRAGEVIDAAATVAGDAARLYGLQFAIDDTSELYAQARMDAVRRAATQARQLARASGVELGAIRSIREEPAGRQPLPTYDTGASGAARLAVPLEPGTQELRLQVTVVYEIDD